MLLTFSLRGSSIKNFYKPLDNLTELPERALIKVYILNKTPKVLTVKLGMDGILALSQMMSSSQFVHSNS